ncbi:MAG TPA: DUF1501 domain-containing protein [Pirellulales bacterium]|nr:DUF1501 domain-containing protein [Pirellulales bacterium]
MNNSTRRDFLKLCGATGLGLTVPWAWPTGSPAAGQDAVQDGGYPGPYYLVFNAEGGWDTTYLMDPKGVNGMNRLYQEGDILTRGPHKFAPTAKHKSGGLSNEDFYAEFGDELLVLNGLDYSVNNHSPGARYMATGKLDSLAYPTFAALVAACKGPTCPLAFLTFGNYSATGNIVAMSRVAYAQSLQKIANADAMDGNERSPYHDGFALDRIERAVEATYQARVEPSSLPRLERAQNMLYAAQVHSKALRRVTPYIPKTQAKERLAQQVDVALASFKAGVCVSANLSIGQFDSHANNDPDQMKLIPEFLAGIAYVMHRAEELKMREQLVVIVQSEMGRTPNYNAGNGKDHWSIGSAMFLGQGIKGNRVLGATDDKLQPVPINPQTLALDAEGGLRVRPEHIHHALREHAGIVDNPLSKKFPFEIADIDKLRGLWG